MCPPPPDPENPLAVPPLRFRSEVVNPETGKFDPPLLKVTLTGMGVALEYSLTVITGRVGV